MLLKHISIGLTVTGRSYRSAQLKVIDPSNILSSSDVYCMTGTTKSSSIGIRLCMHQ